MPERRVGGIVLAPILAFHSLIYISPAAASENRIEIAGQVPILCRAEIDLAERTGRLEEFCNQAAGYDVHLDHGPIAGDSSVTVDGARIPLSPSGSTLVSSSGEAAIRSRTIAFDVPRGTRLVLRLVPR